MMCCFCICVGVGGDENNTFCCQLHSKRTDEWCTAARVSLFPVLEFHLGWRRSLCPPWCSSAPVRGESMLTDTHSTRPSQSSLLTKSNSFKSSFNPPGMLFKHKIIEPNHTKLIISLARGSLTGKSLNLSVIRKVGRVRNHLQPKGFLSPSENDRRLLDIKTLVVVLLEAVRPPAGENVWVFKLVKLSRALNTLCL